MDQTGRKKIIKYICGWFVLATVLTIGFLLFVDYEESINHSQMAMLLQEHPEWESDIIDVFQTTPEIGLFGSKKNADIENQIMMIKEMYGYSFYESTFSSSILWLYIFVMVCSVIGVIILVWKVHSQGNKLAVQYDCLLEELAEELKNFQKGEFYFSAKKESESEASETSEAWVKIWESLRELGFYFADLKEQLKTEENNTKALITDIAHQIKTPLASLRMSHELTMAEDLTEAERQEFKAQEAQEIDNLEKLLNELVKLSRLESQMIQIHPEKQSIKTTIAEAVALVYGKTKGKQSEIQVEIEEDYLILHDRKWTVEALANILDNAIKYSEEQSIVNVRVQKMQFNLLIEVEDEGMGIPSEELHYIFKRFYRGKEAGEKVKDGVGVGLYLARIILEQQGGTITAKRKPEKGTIFRITIPI